MNWEYRNKFCEHVAEIINDKISINPFLQTNTKYSVSEIVKALFHMVRNETALVSGKK